MPELPEVETIRRGLEKVIVGKEIGAIDLLLPRAFLGRVDDVLGAKVESIKRRAKVLCLCLSGDKNLLFHLKMTGQLIYRQRPEAEGRRPGDIAGGHPSHDWHANLPNAQTRLAINFADGSKLFFNDLRMFGWCKVLSDAEIEKVFKEYGPEPLQSSGDLKQTRKAFTVEYLVNQAKRLPKRKIKQFLTDQVIIAGIGNIYADEILFAARISPLRKASDISLSEWQEVHDNTRAILDLAIKHRGTTDSDYVDAEGRSGGMQDYLKIYRRTGEKCPAGCGGAIKRIAVSGRGTHYCPACQH
ncbi:MAG: bifunctional DNA-formamidopyrimidine glycosylase/DNA-(apurinic or apyrimidinic site) lyase [Patescibacteria group bacterium]